MSINLTAEEASKVARAAGSGLTYFNAGTGEITEISGDFEAFLALADAGTKAAATSWLTTLMAPLAASINRKTFYLSCLVAEGLDLADQKTQLDTFLLGYNEFRDTFPGDARFSEVAEVNMIVQDSALVIDELAHMGEQITHQTVTLIDLNRFGDPTGDGGISEDRKKQALSWIVPLSVPLTV